MSHSNKAHFNEKLLYFQRDIKKKRKNLKSKGREKKNVYALICSAPCHESCTAAPYPPLLSPCGRTSLVSDIYKPFNENYVPLMLQNRVGPDLPIPRSSCEFFSFSLFRCRWTHCVYEKFPPSPVAPGWPDMYVKKQKRGSRGFRLACCMCCAGCKVQPTPLRGLLPPPRIAFGVIAMPTPTWYLEMQPL